MARRWMLVALGAAAIASSAAAAELKVVVPPPAAPSPLPPGVEISPVSLTRLAADIPAGTPWLQEFDPVYFLTPCLSARPAARWREEDNRLVGLDDFSRVFRDELSAAGLRAAGGGRNLFEDERSADLQVGALVTSLKVRLCTTVSVVTNVSGLAAMDIEWQVYSASQGKVIGRIATQGGADIRSLSDGYRSEIVTKAFADNVRRLAADKEFQRLVTAPPRTEGRPTPLALRFTPAQPAAVPLSAAVKSVVLIFAGDGRGSGVLISDDGYILTNHHVAGEAGPVRIRWADGSESVGEVVRADARRDVALIKASPRANALPIRATAAQLGEPVFAVGTPLDQAFANTLTRGVVSATRLVDGKSLIQSDVAVDRGNSGGPLLDAQGHILALTVSGYRPDGVSHSINFFIPIDDALKALALTPTS